MSFAVVPVPAAVFFCSAVSALYGLKALIVLGRGDAARAGDLADSALAWLGFGVGVVVVAFMRTG